MITNSASRMTEHTTNAAEELAPCPFCGGNEISTFFHRDRGMGDSWHVECLAENCGCGTAHHDAEAEAITAWNTRHTQADNVLREARDLLRAAADAFDRNSIERDLSQTIDCFLVRPTTEPNPEGMKALQWLANEETLAEALASGAPRWVNLSPEDRVARIGQRKEARDNAILAARKALTDTPSHGQEEPVPPLRVDWNKPDLAEAYDLIEGVRRQAAQNPESGIDSSLRAALDAVEAADCEWDGFPPNEDDFTYIEDLRDAENAHRAKARGEV